MLRIHFLAADQEFCIGMHWAGDPYLINFIWHTQTSTFITMSDFPMLIQFKATASPFLFFEERVIFSNRMSQGYITMSTFICGSLMQRNVYYIFKKHILSPIPPSFHKSSPNNAVRESIFLWHFYCLWAAKFFFALENIWVLVLMFSNLYTNCNEFCNISGDYPFRMHCPECNGWGYESKVKTLWKIPTALLWWNSSTRKPSTALPTLPLSWCRGSQYLETGLIWIFCWSLLWKSRYVPDKIFNAVIKLFPVPVLISNFQPCLMFKELL